MEPAGLRSPPGRVDRVSSGLTGGLIQYFTPLPLHLLLKASASLSDTNADKYRVPVAVGQIFAGCLSSRSGEIAPNLAALHFEAISETLNTDSISSLVSIAKRIDSRVNGLRSEIVFADSPIPSCARITFTRPEDVFGLLESSIKEGREIDKPSPYVTACVVGFFLAYLHPFNDANGRWSRVLVSSGFGGGPASFDAVICAFFLYVYKKELTRSVWPSCMRNGLASYINIAIQFRNWICNAAGDVFDSVEKLSVISKESIPDEKARKVIEKKIFCYGRISAIDFKGKYQSYAEELISRVSVDVPMFSGNGSVTSARAWEELMNQSSKFLTEE